MMENPAEMETLAEHTEKPPIVIETLREIELKL
jgi:hypothetical protein